GTRCRPVPTPSATAMQKLPRERPGSVTSAAFDDLHHPFYSVTVRSRRQMHHLPMRRRTPPVSGSRYSRFASQTYSFILYSCLRRYMYLKVQGAVRYSGSLMVTSSCMNSGDSS